MAATSDRARLIGFVATNSVRRVLSRVGAMFSAGLPFDGRAQTRLLIAPHDLRTADPTIAADIYRGRFSLSGSAADIGSTSPFQLRPPTRAWEEELHSFSWLRHLHAADDAVSRVHARALIGDWITSQTRDNPVAWRSDILARRIIAWLAHSPLYLANAEPEFYRAVMRSLGRQLRYLARNLRTVPDGLPRLTALIAMSYATLCISGLERLQVRAVRLLAAELARQVLPDGGHISRNPGAVLDLLLDLLPLRQTFVSRDVVPPQELLGAIDRMMPMVRFFRHGDGGFALFNGMGRTPLGAVSAVLAYDDTRGGTPDQAPHSGYHRMQTERATLLIDAGSPPPTSVSHLAHAGCLSFELSVGKDRMITNCGTSLSLRDEWQQAARATAAHSTITIGDASSCRFVSGGMVRQMFGTPIVSGPQDTPSARFDNDEELIVEARHDGYRRLGLIHHRRLTLSRDGQELEGQDRLTRSNTLFSRTRPYAIRFHLHPGVRVTKAQDGRSVILTLPSKEAWRFSISGASLRIEESVFLADPKGARPASQIVVSGQCGNETVVRWAVRRGLGERAPRVREVRDGEREEQVLPAAIDPVDKSGREAAVPAEPVASARPRITRGTPAGAFARLTGRADTPPAEPSKTDAIQAEPDPSTEIAADAESGARTDSAGPPPQPQPPEVAEPQDMPPADEAAPQQTSPVDSIDSDTLNPADREPAKTVKDSLQAAFERVRAERALDSSKPTAPEDVRPPEPGPEPEQAPALRAEPGPRLDASIEPSTALEEGALEEGAVEEGASDRAVPDEALAAPEAEKRPAGRRSRLASIFGRRANFEPVPDAERAPRHREEDPAPKGQRREPSLGIPAADDEKAGEAAPREPSLAPPPNQTKNVKPDSDKD